MSGKLVIVSAPSGAGKTTLVKEVIDKPDFNLMFSISATTRRPRKKEKNGIDYYFISVDEFKKKIQNKEFVEWQEVYPNQFYGTLKSEIDRIWNLDKNVIFDVDVKGGINIKKMYGDRALSIFIKPPSLEELKNRLLNRGTENDDTLKKRLKKAEYELTFANDFDAIIVNDDLQKAVEEFKKILKKFLF